MISTPDDFARLGLYVLDGHTPVPARSILEWANFFENTDNRRVADTTIGSIRVSTIFLGADHGCIGQGPPLLYETMVFGPEDDEPDVRRYSTWDEAVIGHEQMVERLEAR